MDAHDHRAIYERFVREVLEQNNLAALEELVDEHAVSHTAALGQPGREGIRNAILQFHGAFGNARFELRDTIVEGEKVVGFYRVTAVHHGDFMGIAATGEPITYDGMSIVRFERGRIVEHWSVNNVAEAMAPLGRIQEAPQPDTHPNLIPIAQAEVIKQFFANYAEHFNRSLAGEHVQAKEVADSFAEHFVEASPHGVNGSKNGLMFRWMIPSGFAHYKKIGTRSMNIENVEVETIDLKHALAKVHWDTSYEKDGKSDHIEFDVTYLLHFEGAKPKIFAYITGDEAQVLKDHGLS